MADPEELKPVHDEGEDAVLYVAGLQKSFGSVQAVRDVSFSVRRGETFGLLGPNGAGKSTTIYCLTGLLVPSAGELLVQGHPAGSPEAKRQIGFVPDDLPLPGTLTGREYLAFVERVFAVDDPRRRAVMVDVFDLEAALDRLIQEYSHGMQKKLQIIAALLHDPVCLVLDEPFSGLDPEAMMIVRYVLTGRQEQRKTILLTTHDLRAAAEFCDRIGIIAEGRLIVEGTPKELREAYGGASLQDVYLEATGLKRRAGRVQEMLSAI